MKPFNISKIKVGGILIFIVCAALNAKAQKNSLIVKTDKGYIHGLLENGIPVFKGVPYAAPPLGALRFMPPAEHEIWTDTLAAVKFGPAATQPVNGAVVGSEDCLSLNIYTPKTDNRKRAVVVWVHGGSMTNGAGKYMDGHAFADNDDIVTITINYRLGAFGFLYLGDTDKGYASSGNNGVLDVIMALKWIKQNIAAFGGDPGSVTIMGESAGAKLISAVLVSPLSKGLFQQYIAESGSVQCIRDTVTAKNERLILMKQLGLASADTRKLFDLPADSIIKAQGLVCAGIGGNSFFGPVYDGKIISEDAYQYAAGKNMPAIKAIIGTNKYEGAAFIGPNTDVGLSNGAILKALFRDNYPIVYSTYQDELKTSEPYSAAVKVLTQYMYQMHSYRFAKVLVKKNIPVWMYRFDYDNGSQYGAKHGQELPYIWNEHNLNASTDTIKRQLEHNLHNAWVAFIKTGDPNIKSATQWPKYNNDTRQVMVFDRYDKVEGLKDVFDDKSFPSAVFVLK